MSTPETRTPAVLDGEPFTIAEAAAAGLDRSALRRLRRTSRVRLVVRGVYVDASVPDSIPLRAAAIAKITPEHAVVCRRTAAWLYGIDSYALQDFAGAPPVECLSPSEKRAVRRSGTVGHAQTVWPGDVRELHGLQVTTPVATGVHLARHLPRPFGLSAIDALCHAGLITPAELQSAVRRYPHHPGIVRARELALLAEPLAESPGESWLRLRLLDAGLGSPVAQHEIVIGKQVLRVDLAYPRPLARTGRPLALEYDSDEWHGTPEQQYADGVRRAKLQRAGWDVISVRRTDVWGSEPEFERDVAGRMGMTPALPRRW